MRKVHLVGIGGAGMSAIAWVLKERGYSVTGSDREPSIYSKSLEEAGLQVQYGHRPENLGKADFVVASAAIPADNVELVTAEEQGIPVHRREQFLPELLNGYRTIAVAGTHGKTTTSAMIAVILDAIGLDPSFIVGGMVSDFERNARVGESKYFVIEADEYAETFLNLDPELAVVTAVEHDHPDCYPTFEDFQRAFQQFADRVSGVLIVNADDEAARRLKPGTAEVKSFGLSADAEWRGVDIQVNSAGGSDFVVFHAGETLGLARIRLPGEHNVRNALAAIAASVHLGLEIKEILEALSRFQGIRRRFEVIYESEPLVVVDDYAHHPTEVMVTLAAARERYPDRKVWAVFQPHTYSRVRLLMDELSSAFRHADHVVITEVYAAREDPDPEYGGKQIASFIDHPNVQYTPTLEEAADWLDREINEKAVVITLSAGDGNKVGELLVEKRKGRE